MPFSVLVLDAAGKSCHVPEGDGAGVNGFDDGLFHTRVRSALGRCQKTGAHIGGFRAEHQRSHYSSGVYYTTTGNKGDTHRLRYLRRQHKGGQLLAPQVTACLIAFTNHSVYAVRFGFPGMVH